MIDNFIERMFDLLLHIIIRILNDLRWRIKWETSFRRFILFFILKFRLNCHWNIIISLILNNFWFFRLMCWLLSVSLNLDSAWFNSTALVCRFVLNSFSGARLIWRLYLRSLLSPLNIDSRWCFSWLLSLFLWCLGWWCRIHHLPSSFITWHLFGPCPTLRSTVLLGRLPFPLLAFLIALSPLLLLLFDAGVIVVRAAAALFSATFFITVMGWVCWWLNLRWRLRGAFGRSGWDGVRLDGGKLVTCFH